MLDKRLVYTCAALGAVIMMAVAAASFPVREEILPSRENVSDVELPIPVEAPEPEYAYLLREYEGRIGVFVWGVEEPEMVLDVPVRYLPDLDRELMREGIPADSYGELVALIEDYSS